MPNCASSRQRERGRSQRATSSVGALTVDLAEDEIVTEIVLPKLPPGTGWGFEEVARRSGDFALAAVAATLTLSDGAIAQARIAHDGRRADAAARERSRGPAGGHATRRRASATMSSRPSAPTSSPKPTCTPRPTIVAISSACSPARHSPPHGNARATHEHARHHRDGQRHRASPRGRAAAAAVGFPASDARPHRHACRLRARRLRRVHDPARRRQRARLPDVRRAGGRLPHRDGRRPRPDRQAQRAAGVVSRASRAAVRLLHARHADDGDRSCCGSTRSRPTTRSARACPAISAAAPATSTSSRRSAPSVEESAR